MIDSHFVEQIFVYGDSYKNYLISIIVPDRPAVVEFLKSKNIECNKDNCSEYFENQELKNEILKDLDILATKFGFKGFEKIKKIYLSPEPFTVQNDLCTLTLKVRRHIEQKYFDDKIAQLYKDD